MPDNAASIHSRWAIWWHGLALIVAALGVGAVLITMIFLILRAQTTYALESRFIQLESACRDQHAQQAAAIADMDNRLDLLERTIFGDVIPKIDKSKGATVPMLEELHFRNERELRQRVERLERWRLAMIE